MTQKLFSFRQDLKENKGNESGFLRENIKKLIKSVVGSDLNERKTRNLLNKSLEILLNLENEEWNSNVENLNGEKLNGTERFTLFNSTEERRESFEMEKNSISFQFSLSDRRDLAEKFDSYIDKLCGNEENVENYSRRADFDESARSVCSILFKERNLSFLSKQKNNISFSLNEDLLAKRKEDVDSGVLKETVKNEGEWKEWKREKDNLLDWLPSFTMDNDSSFQLGSLDSMFQIPSLQSSQSQSRIVQLSSIVPNNPSIIPQKSIETKEEMREKEVLKKKLNWFELARETSQKFEDGERKGEEKSDYEIKFLNNFKPFYLDCEIPIQIISRKELERSLFVMMNQSIPSRLFEFDEEDCRFKTESHGQFQLKDWKSGDSLHSLLKQFCSMGTLVARLHKFLNRFDGESDGMIVLSFVNCVKENVNSQQLNVTLALEQNSKVSLPYLFDYSIALKPFLHNLKILAQLCKIKEEENWKGKDPFEGFPKGVDLLNHVYFFARSHHIHDSEFLEDLFRRTCIPFLLEVENWIFDGKLNPFGELNLKENQLKLPSFLESVAKEIFECGELIEWMTIRSRDSLEFSLISLEQEISFFGNVLTKERETLGIQLDSHSLSTMLRISENSRLNFDRIKLIIESHFGYKSISQMMSNSEENEKIAEEMEAKRREKIHEFQEKKRNATLRKRERQEVEFKIIQKHIEERNLFRKNLMDEEKKREEEEEERKRREEKFVNEIVKREALKMNSIYTGKLNELENYTSKLREKGDSLPLNRPSPLDLRLQLMTQNSTFSPPLDSPIQDNSSKEEEKTILKTKEEEEKVEEEKAEKKEEETERDEDKIEGVDEKNGEEFIEKIDSLESLSNEMEEEKQEEETEEKEWGIVPLERMIKALVIDPILFQHRLLNFHTLSHFVTHLGLWDYINSLRSFVLLSAGDFNDTFSSLLFVRIQTLPTVSANELNSILRRSFEASSSTSHFGKDRISLIVKKPSLFNNENALELLEMSFRLDYPLDQIIRREEMDRYNSVFTFLVKLKRVNFALRQIWILSKNANQRNQNALSIDLLRHRMNHFITTLQSYVINQIHNISWDELKEKMKRAKSLFEVRDFHSNYLKNIQKRCMLTEKAKPVMSILENIFSLCIKLHTQIFSRIDYTQFSMDVQSSAQNWTFETDEKTMKSISSTQKSFDQSSQFLLDVLKKSFEKTHNREIGILLCTMNILPPSSNPFFSVNV
eukprot:TRINITY_DN6500_c0_g3_i1.p1 TRINITY_DN6500_c0_g3~~TRINITY_DN6500_c0_g3_i1.p1  ORF type:complete len:1220 (+),score=563.42 TRINITY_DN6500_c0_g3_i1:88-3747(+)